MMKNYALYFMPDISGFTNFVTHTEIEHSKHIISELLELLIDSNTIDLKLAEIEGDALFMFTETLPSFNELIEQSTAMLDAFSAHLDLYNTNRICNCGACISAHDLKVKFIIHYGEISFIRVKDIVKPYGGDVIKIHRFLKNSIPSNQYLLISKETIDFYNESILEFGFEEKADVYDFGRSHYFFKTLQSKKNKIEHKIVKPNFLPQINEQIIIPKDVNHVYQFISDFSLRTSWYKLVERLDYDALRLNRVGTTHQCISGSDVFKVETLGDSQNNAELIYGERTADIENLKGYTYYLTVTPNGDTTTQLTIEVFLEFEELNDEKKQEVLQNIKEAWQKSIFHLTKEVLNNNN